MPHCLLSAASAGDTRPLIPETFRGAGMPHHRMASGPLPTLPAGTGLFDNDGTERLRVTGRIWLPGTPHALPCPLLTALDALPAGEMRLQGAALPGSLCRIRDLGACATTPAARP